MYIAVLVNILFLAVVTESFVGRQVFKVPLVIGVLVVVRLVMWRLAKAPEDSSSSRHIRRSMMVTVLVAAGVSVTLSFWSLYILNQGDAPERAYIGLFTALCTISCAACLSSLPLAAYTVVGIGTVPVSVALLITRCAKRGEHGQAIGRSRGGRTTKIHILVDEQGRPHVVQLTAGQASDIVAAIGLITASRPSLRLLADRAYDGDALRCFVNQRGTTPVIPNKRNRINHFPFDRDAYKLRNAVKRAFCRIKDFRAVATRYDRLARNFLAGICIVAALTFWIN